MLSTLLAVCLVAGTINSCVADSCKSRCGDHSSSYDCQCNTACVTYSDCCADYYKECTGAQSISQSELSSLAQNLWNNDVNRLSSAYYTTNKQTQLSNYNDKVDRSPADYYTYVNTGRLGGTWPYFESLLDNYILKTGNAEVVTPEEEAEISSFLDQVMNTQVMQLTYDLLNSKGYFSSQTAFRTYIHRIWFDLYSRSSGKLDSSAFEHTFVGEVKNSAVSGFHNWLQFYHMEQDGRLDYYGWVREKNPDQILLQFDVDGYVKTLSSLMLGVSPEFEIALYSVCFISDPNKVRSFTLQGNTAQIQTYDYAGGLVGSAYFNV